MVGRVTATPPTAHPPLSVWHAVLHEPVALATVLLVFVTAGLWIGTLLLWRATVRLARESKEGAELQAGKLERSASAMERVADSMKVNATQIVRSVDMQRRFGEMQLRAHVTVLIGQSVHQDENLRFESRPRLLNTGHTAASNVRWRIAADVLTVPIASDFRFPLPAGVACGGSILGPQQDGFMQAVVSQRVDDDVAQKAKRGMGYSLYVWGYVSYEDQFRTTHRCTFAQQVWWEPYQTSEGKLSEILRVAYLARHNRAN
jgi:hypothetical protein